MRMSIDRANYIMLLDPRTCDKATLDRVIMELETRTFPFKESTRETLLFDFKFERNHRA